MMVDLWNGEITSTSRDANIIYIQYKLVKDTKKKKKKLFEYEYRYLFEKYVELLWVYIIKRISLFNAVRLGLKRYEKLYEYLK